MKKAILLSAVAVLVAFPLANTVQSIPTAYAVQQQAQQYQQLLALGGSLNPYQAQQTLQLLGVGQINPNNTVYVDGNMINKYLNDGSGPGTIVYSSAVIQQMQAGNGVMVQIVTPQNITLVSPATYQNAAITAGAQNANIRIAAASPVTGEGALAGVYALLERQGVQVSAKDVQVAQQEIQVVNQVQQSSSQQENALTDQQVNKMLAEIKAEVVSLNEKMNQSQETTAEATTQVEGQNQSNNQSAEQDNQVENETDIDNNTNVTGDNNTVNNVNHVDNSTEINNIVNNIVNQYNITDQSVIQNLQVYANNYADTESAHNPETKDQLQASIQDREPAQAWTTVLQGLSPVTPDQLLDQERIDYSNTEIYSPLMQAIQSELFRRIEAGESIEDLYSATFVYEASQAQISNDNQHALNELRTIMYQYAANEDLNNIGNPHYVPVKDRWLSQIVNLTYTSPDYQEMLRQLTVATGLAPQVYNYQPVDSHNTTINFQVSVDQSDNSTDEIMNVTYDLDNGEMTNPDASGGFLGIGNQQDITDHNYLDEAFDANVDVTRQSTDVNLSVDDIIQTQQVQESQAEMYIPVETSEGFEESYEASLAETSQEIMSETSQVEENISETNLEEASPEETSLEETNLEETIIEETSLETSTVEETTQLLREFPPAQPWANVLQGLTPVPREELLDQEREDFSDSQVFHPLMNEMLTELYARIENNQPVIDLYSHTFVYEAGQDSTQISDADAYAIEYMRSLMYQYTANEDQMYWSDPNVTEYVDVKTRWTQAMADYDNLAYTDPNLHEIYRQIMVATGRAPQVYDFVPANQEGSVIRFEIYYSHPDGHTSDMMVVDYDLVNGSIISQDGGLFGGGDITNTNFLAQAYNVDLDLSQTPMMVDPNYQAPIVQYVEESTPAEEVPVEDVTSEEVYYEETIDPNLMESETVEDDVNY